MPHVIDAFARCPEGTVKMFCYHSKQEDHRHFPNMAKYLREADKDLLMHAIRQIGPEDVSPYISLVATREESVGVDPPQREDATRYALVAALGEAI
jgi:hypothetical protein